jgi:outer membrane biogenesis lipoprotein LolB
MNGKRHTVLVFVTILLAACASTHNLKPQAKVQNQVLTTESQLLAQRSLDADLRARALELSINLARALGGGVV